MRSGAGRRGPGVVADFLRTLSVQPFYVSFIDLVLFLPRPPLEPFSPYLPPTESRPWPSPRAIHRHLRAATPCQDVKAVVKRRASAINHSRSRYYTRNPRVGIYVAVVCLHDLFICDCESASPRFRTETLCPLALLPWLSTVIVRRLSLRIVRTIHPGTHLCSFRTW